MAGEVAVEKFSGGVRGEGVGVVEIGARAREAEVEGEGSFVIWGGGGGGVIIGGFRREGVEEREGLRRRGGRRRAALGGGEIGRGRRKRDEGEGIGREEIGVIRVCHGSASRDFAKRKKRV